MKTMLLTFVLFLWACWLAPSQAAPGGEELPRDVAVQERYVLLSAKVKKMAEIQDLIVQQQQLILQHLSALEAEVRLLQAQRSNGVTAAEFTRCVEKLARLEKRFETAQETNRQAVCGFVQDLLGQTDKPQAAGRSDAPTGWKLEPYKVQAGDTLLRIIARMNDLLEKNHSAKVTQEQVEKANPGLTPDKIRAGQMIFIPLPAGP